MQRQMRGTRAQMIRGTRAKVIRGTRAQRRRGTRAQMSFTILLSKMTTPNILIL